MYALFHCLVVIEKDENNKPQYSFTNLTGKEIYPDFLDRLLSLNKKDKKLKVAKDIERIFNELKKKYKLN